MRSIVTYNNCFPVAAGPMAVEIYVRGPFLPDVAGAKVDAVTGQTQRGQVQVGTERHRLDRDHRKEQTF